MHTSWLDRSRRPAARHVLAAAVACAFVGGVAATLPAVAMAGTYAVYACQNGYGTGAFSTWTGWPAEFDQSQNCTQPPAGKFGTGAGRGGPGQGDGLSVWSSSRAADGGDFEYWNLTAPAGTMITSLSYSAAFAAWGGWTAQWQAYSGASYTDAGDPASAVDCSSTNCNIYGTDPDTWTVAVNNASRIGFGIWCHASSCPVNSSDSLFGPAASINMFNAAVQITEPSAPRLTLDPSPASWISDRNAPSGGWAVDGSSSDPAGICDESLSVRSLTSNDDVTPNYGSATPCAGGGASLHLQLNPCSSGGLGTGTYTPTLSATNPAGMSSSTDDASINVECSGPQVTVTSTEDLGAWYPGQQTVDVDASDPSGLQGNVTCTVGSSTVTIAPSQLPYALPVSENGQNSVSCTAQNTVNYSTTTSLNGSVKIDSQTPSVAFTGAASAPAWVSGPQTIEATGSEPQQLSGIQSVSCQLDGGGWTTTDGSVAGMKLTTDGVHTISCFTTTGAGVKSATETDKVQIDSVPPTVGFLGGPSQSTWGSGPESIEVTATKPAGSSGVSEIVCTLAGLTTTYPNSGNPDSEMVKITVSASGDLSCKAQDGAGNQAAPQAWSFLIDSSSPTGEFLPASAQNPTQVQFQAADSGSGVAGVTIELQTAAGWEPLATSFDASTGIATATIPDDGSISDGTHNLQALVWSVAGTEATISQAATGILGQAAPAAVTLPLRIVTKLSVGQAEAIVTKCVVRREVLRKGRHPASKLKRVCSHILVPHSSGTLKLAYGQRATVRGLLNTVDGDPIPQATVHISQQASGSWSARSAGTVGTNSSGQFTYTLPVGPSRTVTFSYHGTATMRPSSAATSVESTGKVSLTIGRTAVAGHELRFSGQVYGGYIPAGGASVQLQYRAKGSPVGWEPFGGPVRTDGAGRWSVTVRLYTGAAGYTYEFSAMVGPQTGWPWMPATSRPVARFVAHP